MLIGWCFACGFTLSLGTLRHPSLCLACAADVAGEQRPQGRGERTLSNACTLVYVLNCVYVVINCDHRTRCAPRRPRCSRSNCAELARQAGGTMNGKCPDFWGGGVPPGGGVAAAGLDPQLLVTSVLCRCSSTSFERCWGRCDGGFSFVFGVASSRAVIGDGGWTQLDPNEAQGSLLGDRYRARQG